MLEVFQTDQSEEGITEGRLWMPVTSRTILSYPLSVLGNIDGELFWILLFGCYLSVSKARPDVSRGGPFCWH